MSNVSILTYPGNGVSSPLKKRRRSLSSIFRHSFDKTGNTPLPSTTETAAETAADQTSPTTDGRIGHSALPEERTSAPSSLHEPWHISLADRSQSIKTKPKWNSIQPTSPTTRFTSVARIHPKDLKNTLSAVYDANDQLASMIAEQEEAEIEDGTTTIDASWLEVTVPRQVSKQIPRRTQPRRKKTTMTLEAKRTESPSIDKDQEQIIYEFQSLLSPRIAEDMTIPDFLTTSPRSERMNIDDNVHLDHSWTSARSPKPGSSAPASLHKLSRTNTPDGERSALLGSKENMSTSIGYSKPRRKSISEFAKVVFRSSPQKHSAHQVVTSTTSSSATY